MEIWPYPQIYKYMQKTKAFLVRPVNFYGQRTQPKFFFVSFILQPDGLWHISETKPRKAFHVWEPVPARVVRAPDCDLSLCWSEPLTVTPPLEMTRPSSDSSTVSDSRICPPMKPTSFFLSFSETTVQTQLHIFSRLSSIIQQSLEI